MNDWSNANWMRPRIGCELSVWKSSVCARGDRLVIKQFPYYQGKERCLGFTNTCSSIQMSDETCLMYVWISARKVGFDPTTVECCSTVDLSAEDSGTMPCETRNVSWRFAQSLPSRKDMMLNVSRRRFESVLHVLC